MPHLITYLAIVYVVAVATYMAYNPEEDLEALGVILMFVVPLTIVAFIVDQTWGK